MTHFFYTDGREEEQLASDLQFKPSLGLLDADDDATVHTFDRQAAHIPGRCTVVYVERGCPRDVKLQIRIRAALASCKPVAEPAAPEPYFWETPPPKVG